MYLSTIRPADLFQLKESYERPLKPYYNRQDKSFDVATSIYFDAELNAPLVVIILMDDRRNHNFVWYDQAPM